MSTDRNTLRAVLKENFPRDHGQLLPALHFLQHEFGYLPDWAMEVVGWHLGIPSSEVYGAATSYTELKTEKPTQHVLRICTGLSCWLQGGGDLFNTTDAAIEDNEFVSVEETPCGFACAVGPAIQWDGKWHGHASQTSIDELMNEAGIL